MNSSFFRLRRGLTVGTVVGAVALVAPAQANSPPKEVLVRGGGQDVRLVEPHGCIPTGEESHPCADPGFPANEVGLRPGGRVYVSPNFFSAVTKLNATLHDEGQEIGNRYVVRKTKLVAIRRKRGWTLCLPALISRKVNTLELRFFKDGRLHSQWIAPVKRVSR